MTTQDILNALNGLDEEIYDVHVTDNAWYSVRAMTAALGHESYKNFPTVQAVRVRLQEGMLELHPTEDNKINIKCYCCFGGDPNKGIVSLDKLKESVIALKDHYCPPWPG